MDTYGVMWPRHQAAVEADQAQTGEPGPWNENALPKQGVEKNAGLPDQTLLSGKEAFRSAMKARRASSIAGSSSGPV